jgi:hypothetical protein
MIEMLLTAQLQGHHRPCCLTCTKETTGRGLRRDRTPATERQPDPVYDSIMPISEMKWWT